MYRASPLQVTDPEEVTSCGALAFYDKSADRVSFVLACMNCQHHERMCSRGELHCQPNQLQHSKQLKNLIRSAFRLFVPHPCPQVTPSTPPSCQATFMLSTSLANLFLPPIAGHPQEPCQAAQDGAPRAQRHRLGRPRHAVRCAALCSAVLCCTSSQ